MKTIHPIRIIFVKQLSNHNVLFHTDSVNTPAIGETGFKVKGVNVIDWAQTCI